MVGSIARIGARFKQSPSRQLEDDAILDACRASGQFGRDCAKRPKKPIERYARRVEMMEIVANDCNLNISRYVGTAQQEVEIDLAATHREQVAIAKTIRKATAKHNRF